MHRQPSSVKPRSGKPDTSSFEKAWRRRFGEFAAAREDDAGIAGWTPTGLDARMRKFLSLCHEFQLGQLWLDAGCGAGTYTRLLAEQGLRVVGVDYSFVATAKACARDSSGSAYAVADVRHLPFPARTFQGVLCFGVTQALSGSDALMRELTRLVAPGGELWIDGLNRRCLLHVAQRARRFVGRRPMHLRYEAPGQIVRLMRNAGFADVRRYWMPIAPSRMPRLQRFFEHPFVCGLFEAVPPLGMLVSHSFIVRGRCPS